MCSALLLSCYTLLSSHPDWHSSYYATILLGPTSNSTSNGSSVGRQQQSVNVIIDTGSNLLWVQCQGCNTCTADPAVSGHWLLTRQAVKSGIHPACFPACLLPCLPASLPACIACLPACQSVRNDHCRVIVGMRISQEGAT